MNNRNQSEDRRIGYYWEERFSEILIQFGLSSDKSTPWDADLEVWDIYGSPFKAQVRHKEPFRWSDIGLCYGYERYRIDKDMEEINRGYISIYVVHDYSHFGKYSEINRLEDWYAQYIEQLNENIVKEVLGWTYYGGQYLRLPICYWQLTQFKPLNDILIDLKGRMEYLPEVIK